jgi:hypothetical protein
VVVAGGCVLGVVGETVVVGALDGGGVVVDGGVVVVVVVEEVVVVALGSGRLNDGSDSRSVYCSGSLPSWPHTYTRSPRSTSSGKTSASEFEMRTQPCDAGKSGTLRAPWMAMP